MILAGMALLMATLPKSSGTPVPAFSRVVADPGQRRGEAFLPMHWSLDNASSAMSALTHAVTDPVSGQPDLKGATIRIAPLQAKLHGLILSRSPLRLDAIYWGAAEDRWRLRDSFCS